MADSTLYIVSAIAVMTAVTFASRLLPFIFFSKLAHSPLVALMGRNLPVMIMPILVLYCLRYAWQTAPTHGAFEVVGIAAVAFLHWRWSNALLSIFGGSGIYLLLRNFIAVAS